RVARHLVGSVGRFVTQPSKLPARATQAARLVGSLQRQALSTEPARSDVMHARSLTRHFETYALRLPEFHRAAQALGGSVNDLYVAGLAGALGPYHEPLRRDV